MHDRYCYEKVQMALHDDEVERFLACGVAGLSVITDSLSAIKYASVTPVYGENGLITDFNIEGDFPKYGNDDDRVDKIAVEVLKGFEEELKNTPAYRNAKHTLSALTITAMQAARWLRLTRLPRFLTNTAATAFRIPSR